MFLKNEPAKRAKVFSRLTSFPLTKLRPNPLKSHTYSEKSESIPPPHQFYIPVISEANMITNSAGYNQHYRDLDLINENPAMTLAQICYHEHLEMYIRRLHGYAQHDDHVWRWLNHQLNRRRPRLVLKIESEPQ
jgi:hypothetical protein